MKKIASPLLALSLLTALPVFAADTATVAPILMPLPSIKGKLKLR